MRKLHILDEKLRVSNIALFDALYKLGKGKGEVSDLKLPIFTFLCDQIYEAAKTWTEVKSDFSFYFWPGYESVRSAVTNKRVSLNINIPTMNSGREPYWTAECGISPCYEFNSGRFDSDRLDAASRSAHMKMRLRGVQGAETASAIDLSGLMKGLDPELGTNSYRILENPTAMWFSTLLTPASKDERSGGFIPGGTHSWLNTFRDQSLLKGLLVDFTRSGHATAPESARIEHFILVSLGPESISDGGLKLGKILELYSKTSWPNSEGSSSSTNKTLQRELYTAWLKSVFAPAGEHDNVSHVFALIEKHPELTYLRKRMERLVEARSRYVLGQTGLYNQIVNRSTYRHWYALRFDSENSMFRENSENQSPAPLGTAMIFSERRFDTIFLSKIREWIERIYIGLRHFEYIKMGEESGKRDQRYVFAHEVKGKVQTILTDPNLNSLTQTTQDVIRLLYFDVLLWSSICIEQSTPAQLLYLKTLVDLAERTTLVHLKDKLSTVRKLQIGISDDDNDIIKSRLRRTLYTPGYHCALSTLCDSATITAFGCQIETNWFRVLQSAVFCAFRQSLCHSILFYERSELRQHRPFNVLRFTVSQRRGRGRKGVIIRIENQSFDKFEPKQSAENTTMEQLVSLTSGPQGVPDAQGIRYKWRVREDPLDPKIFISCVKVFDPTARILR